jgi:L-iditol 2-dehydrogenase
MSAQVAQPNASMYDPRKVLDAPEFRILKDGEIPGPEANVAAFYNPAHEIHLVEKPKGKPSPGTGVGACEGDGDLWVSSVVCIIEGLQRD